MAIRVISVALKENADDSYNRMKLAEFEKSLNDLTDRCAVARITYLQSSAAGATSTSGNVHSNYSTRITAIVEEGYTLND